MLNFNINFAVPWLLLLLIPAIALTLIPYFRVNKKYRRNRTRITSMVLHFVIMFSCIAVFAGITFSFDKINKENEVILLVDKSFTGQGADTGKDEFIQSAIFDMGAEFKLGIVTFGYDQVYAAGLNDERNELYDKYLNAPLPDESATDIEAALNFTKTLFTNPQTAKIVLITDGIETDGEAMSVIKSIAAEGIKVDTVFFPYEQKVDVQLIGVESPDYNIVVGDTFTLGLTVQSKYDGAASVTLIDNGVEHDEGEFTFREGVQTFNLEHTFDSTGMHELCFKIKADNQDTLSENNVYYSYIYLEVFDKILIIESNDKESEPLENLLRELEEDEYEINVVNVFSDSMPSTLAELREYDEVVLVNIANDDLPAGFDEILHSYVYDIGGGLFTVGGNESDGETPHAYNRTDMYGTLYQQMLPVQVIEYTPPLGVIFIIDRSGSMSSPDSATGKTKLDLAKEGAINCLQVLTERDYVGVLTLENDYREELAMTPYTQPTKIQAAISSIETGGGTVFTPAIARAGATLNSLDVVEKKHIILITDGVPSDTLENDYGPEIERYAALGITFSLVAIGIDSASALVMQEACKKGNGEFYNINDGTKLIESLIKDLRAPQIKDVTYEPFRPTIKLHNSVTSGVTQDAMPKLNGYYGTKLKNGAESALVGEYVPVYAQWKYGEGRVGSFLCNLNPLWSGEFLGDRTGQRIINNIIKTLFPTENIRVQDIDAGLDENNYSTKLSIYTSMQREETIRVTITGPEDENGEAFIQTIIPSAAEGYSRAVFNNKLSGIYTVLIEKLDSAGAVVSSYTAYRTFSYSAEYDNYKEPEDCLSFLTDLAKSGKGEVIDEAEEIFRDSVKSIRVTYDPRVFLIILSLILFLLDIAVRKFKFKWPHEIIRDYKAKKAMSNKE